MSQCVSHRVYIAITLCASHFVHMCRGHSPNELVFACLGGTLNPTPDPDPDPKDMLNDEQAVACRAFVNVPGMDSKLLSSPILFSGGTNPLLI